ncbi:hypothetical protein [Okeania sp. SIO1F9]|uniref:hypothetical protein n=1 Tax=Okeania sp. SIO1F9 TaxID=2607813 RepID=UPI0014510549|nr:hypothetical protein [Okeania sp. SIO1F9]NET75605.1 hypothetical protein [Okeania sp. SIO1F9]
MSIYTQNIQVISSPLVYSQCIIFEVQNVDSEAESWHKTILLESSFEEFGNTGKLKGSGTPSLRQTELAE